MTACPRAIRNRTAAYGLTPLRTATPFIMDSTDRAPANNDRHNRRSIRLQGYDYSREGAYFVTVCANDRTCLFGEIVDGEMRLNDAGRMVEDAWTTLPSRFPSIDIDKFVIMPNHFHGIVVFTDRNAVHTDDVGAPLVGAPIITIPAIGAGTRPAPADGTVTTLGGVVGAFKSMTTDHYILGVRQNDWPAFRGKLWQRNYYEHIIRTDDDMNRIRQYIMNNPLKWEFDRENPGFVATTAILVHNKVVP